MKTAQKKVLLLLLGCTIFINIRAQTGNGCSVEEFLKTKFSADSVMMFNSYNNFRYGIYENIKNSKYPIELRFYNPRGNYTRIIDAYIITGSIDSLRLTKVETWFLSGTLPGYRIAASYLRENVNIKQTQIVLNGNYCDLYNLLKKESLFTVKANKNLNHFKKNKNALHYTDSGSQAYFEIKLGNRFRNFIYDSSNEWLDNDKQREKHIQNIISYLVNNFKEKGK